MTENVHHPKGRLGKLAKYLRGERPDYAYLKSLFQHLRTELEIEVPKTSKKLPYVRTEEELKRYYEVVWKSKNFQDTMIVKTLMYTGIRVSELINVRLTDIDFYYCQVRINNGKGGKDRIVPFPQSFKELLAMHADAMKKNMRSIYLNHRGRKSTRIGEYERFWPNIRRKLKKQGIDDALILPYSSHESRKSLEIYSKLAITDAQQEYNEVINKFPI